MPSRFLYFSFSLCCAARIASAQLGEGAEQPGNWDLADAPPFSFTTAMSLATPGFPVASTSYTIDLPLSGQPGIECRASNGFGGSQRTVWLRFSNTIQNVNSASLTCGGMPFLSYNGNTASVIFFGGGCDGQYITVTLNGVTDTYGQTLTTASVTFGLLV